MRKHTELTPKTHYIMSHDVCPRPGQPSCGPVVVRGAQPQGEVQRQQDRQEGDEHEDPGGQTEWLAD